MGVFNGVTSWIGDIVLPRGFGADDAGLLGLVMLVAGVIGAVVLSAMSDRQGKRVRYLVLTLTLAIPSLIGVAFVSTTLLLYVVRPPSASSSSGRCRSACSTRRR